MAMETKKSKTSGKAHHNHHKQIMASPKTNSSRQKTFIISLLFLSLTLLVVTVLSLRDPKPTDYDPNANNSFSTTKRLHKDAPIPAAKHPQWLKTIVEEKLKAKKNNNDKIMIRVGLVNPKEGEGNYGGARGQHVVEAVQVRFESLAESGLKWEDFFPEWIDEEAKWAPPRCPEVPLPAAEEREYDGLDAVVARVPCGANATATRDVVGLQVNLAAASLAARAHGGAHVVFVGACGPMAEIFRCDDLVRHKSGEFWVYKPEITRLKQKLLMPVGSCQLAPPYALSGKEAWRAAMSKTTTDLRQNHTRRIRPRYAYATIIHSSESYVCGAVALAHSIRRVNSTHDLILLADSTSVGKNSLSALRAAGWKIVPIQRIRSPFAAKDSYNEWNYSKLRMFQLTWYDKVVFIDSDLVVLRNLDHLFFYPALSAAPNDRTLFNSGLMVIEPSACLFEDMMKKSFEIVSYNGGDQGFLNEVFTWWHRLSTKTNYLKVYSNDRREVSDNVEAVHYLGLKPWVCYKDYDCNWDMKDHHIFASDSAHRRWWEVYDSMPRKLQKHCGLTKKMDWRIRKWRRIAMERNLSDNHWRIIPKDPRRHHFVDS